ncbi:hypothetical protein [Acrocarpospora corrugata]|uniref:hypothetical protein n=1 Tax=Acrocarpospora corrugata TaxID=35763 RepID=UPI0012D34101|nr:hypothetical protein [Acrocarpospora corrugata]
MPFRHIDLFDLVVQHHDEPRHLAVHGRDRGVADPLRRAHTERLLGPHGDQFIRNMP